TMLASSYLRIQDVVIAGIFRVDSDGGYNFIRPNDRRNNNFSGIIIPYWHPYNGLVREYVLRLDEPVGKMKYVGPQGRTNLFYIPPGVRPEWLKDTSIPVVFCEGEKKCLALWRIALEFARDGIRLFIPIGLRGVYGWKGVTGKETGPNGERESTKGPLNDFDFFDWENRRVFILFDSNINSLKSETYQSVRGARKGLAHHLHYILSARVFFAEMAVDHFERGLNGPDDLAATDGPDAVLQLLDAAQPAIKPTEPPRREKLTPEQRKERAEAWRKAVSPEKQAAAVLGTTQTKYLARLWAEANISPESRDLLFTLEAMAEGQSELDFFYADLYPLLYKLKGNEFEQTKTGGYILKSSPRSRLRERIEKLEKEQAACRITFADITPGMQDADGNHIPSNVRLFSRGYVAEVMIMAEEDSLYSRGKKAARERAFARFVVEQSGKAYIKKNPPRIDYHKKIADGWKRVQGNMGATIKRMKQLFTPEEKIWRTGVEHMPPEFIEFVKQQATEEAQKGDLPEEERKVTRPYGGEASPQAEPPEVATKICDSCGQTIPPKWVTLNQGLNSNKSTDDFAGFSETCRNPQPEYDPVDAEIWAKVENRAQGKRSQTDEQLREMMDDFFASEMSH
ncbi:MAG TPA: DUF3854 domain-containing protein, partial [Blastocatellia bacterium]|nr:DUF3854 domain-containing protein [Blastocatellia bacterium]